MGLGQLRFEGSSEVEGVQKWKEARSLLLDPLRAPAAESWQHSGCVDPITSGCAGSPAQNPQLTEGPAGRTLQWMGGR